MNTLAKFLSLGSLALVATAGVSFAADSDPGYTLGAPGSGTARGVTNRAQSRYAPEYLRPTQRFYGKGYTVAYRFIPWSDRMRSVNSTSTWDSDQMRLPANAAATTTATGNSPRITYFHARPSAASVAPSPAKGLLPERNSAIVGSPKPLPPVAEAPIAEPPTKQLPPIAEPPPEKK